MRRWVASAALTALACGCTADSSPQPVFPSANVAPDPGGEPEPVDPSDVTYVEWRDTGFTVIESAEADALFEGVAACTSEEGGYSVEYPSNWSTNEGGEAPGCSWFAPDPVSRGPTRLAALVRPDVPIRLSVVQTGLGQIPEHPRILTVKLVLAGRDAVRTEDQVPIEPPWWSYGYSIWLDDDPLGLKFIAGTSSLANGDYVLNKAVLDRMMATLEFTAGDPSPPTPRPTPSAYVERAGYPFTVIESAEADALFATPDTCENPVAGYTVTYPDEWYTNTEIGEWPPCTWFSPIYYEVGQDPNQVPAEIAIELEFGDMSFGYTDEPDFLVADELTVEGFGTSRAEMIGHTAPNGVYSPLPPMYWYIVTIEELPGDSPTVYARTDFEGAADYELNKAVLDRIMALIEFDE